MEEEKKEQEEEGEKETEEEKEEEKEEEGKRNKFNLALLHDFMQWFSTLVSRWNPLGSLYKRWTPQRL